MLPNLNSSPKADILIIDDTPDNLRLLNLMLSKFYKVRLAPSGEIGLTAARSTPPDLILLDVMMPGLNGYEVAERLKADAQTVDIPIIFISALDDTESKVRGFAVGGVDYVTKPFQEMEVLARVKTHLTLRALYQQIQAELVTRKQTEEALKRSESFARSIVENEPECVKIIGSGGILKYMNQAGLAMIEVDDLAMVAGQSVYPIVAPEHRAAFSDLTESVLRGERGRLQFEMIGLKGTRRWLDTHAVPLLDDQGNIEALLGLTRDITEHKRAEEALRASTAKLETLVQVAPLAVTLLDAAGNVQLWNPAAEQIFGWTAPEVIGRPNPIVPDSRQGEYAAWSAQVLRGEPLANQEAMRQRKDGSLVAVSISSAPVFDATGNVIGRMAIIADITERKRAEETLRESESLYESLVEVSPLCICRKDLAGRFTFANRRFLETSHITLADLVGKTDFDIHPPELAEKYQCDERNVIDSGQVWELIEEHRLLGGESSVVQSIKTPIYDRTGNITGVQTSFWDITERKRAESQKEAALEALRELNATLEQRVADRTRELTEANLQLAELARLKDEFITRISHELRSPLANIKLYIQLLEQGQPEKRAAYFLTMHQQTDLLQHLIEDLLDVSHLTLDAIEVRTAPLDVANLLHGLITDRAARALERDLTLTAMPTPDRIVLVTDRNLLRQALDNVLTNALNYTPHGGAISLRTDRLITPDGAWVTIEVRDTGPGISEQDLPRIFEPFYRGAVAADYKIPGTGVGLSIALRLIERLGGRITVESTPGQGAAFTLWLPAAPA